MVNKSLWLLTFVYMPKTRAGKLRAAKRDPVKYCDALVAKMGEFEIQKLLRALHSTVGLTPSEISEEQDEYFRRWRDKRRATANSEAGVDGTVRNTVAKDGDEADSLD